MLNEVEHFLKIFKNIVHFKAQKLFRNTNIFCADPEARYPRQIRINTEYIHRLARRTSTQGLSKYRIIDNSSTLIGAPAKLNTKSSRVLDLKGAVN